MASKAPIVMQVAWISLVPQFTVMAVFIGAAYFSGLDPFPLIGTAAYLGFAILLRSVLARDHRMASKLVRQGEFAQAIPYYERSYEFFSRNKWIDDWRYVTLLSSSQICYREMSLVSEAFCYGQIGDGNKSYELYQRTLREFPESTMAQSAIRLMDSARSTVATVIES
jgi:hypothetical protein